MRQEDIKIASKTLNYLLFDKFLKNFQYLYNIKIRKSLIIYNDYKNYVLNFVCSLRIICCYCLKIYVFYHDILNIRIN